MKFYNKRDVQFRPIEGPIPPNRNGSLKLVNTEMNNQGDLSLPREIKSPVMGVIGTFSINRNDNLQISLRLPTLGSSESNFLLRNSGDLVAISTIDPATLPMNIEIRDISKSNLGFCGLRGRDGIVRNFFPPTDNLGSQAELLLSDNQKKNLQAEGVGNIYMVRYRPEKYEENGETKLRYRLDFIVPLPIRGLGMID